MNRNWRVHLHPDVIRYLYGVRDQGNSIRQAVAAIAKQGLPADARETTRAGFYIWINANHWITFRVEAETGVIYLTGVEPMTAAK